MFDAIVLDRIRYVIVAIKPTNKTIPTTIITKSDFFIIKDLKVNFK
tara:strand:- start:602 stop:739 length:138 start_codon:yes stop_codon:yes gene_type:complete